MNRIAVDRDRSDHDLTLVVPKDFRLAHRTRAALHGEAMRLSGIVDPQRDVTDAVTVLTDVLGDHARARQGRRDHEANLPLRQQIARAIAHARLRAAIADHLEAHRSLVEVRRLFRVSDVELDVIGSVDRKCVVGLFGPGLRHGSRHELNVATRRSERSEGESLLRLLGMTSKVIRPTPEDSRTGPAPPDSLTHQYS